MLPDLACSSRTTTTSAFVVFAVGIPAATGGNAAPQKQPFEIRDYS
jgi:hypothetical protein